MDDKPKVILAVRPDDEKTHVIDIRQPGPAEGPWRALCGADFYVADDGTVVPVGFDFYVEGLENAVEKCSCAPCLATLCLTPIKPE